MNKVESLEDNNHICIKLSGCRRAVRIQNPEHPKRPHMFNFDQIYPPGVTQEAVYQYTGRPLVENTMKGFNSTLFAYGQTGSGKTFSMMGVLDNPELEGVVPKTIREIYQEIDNMDNDDEYEVRMSMCEIYLEKCKDLLGPSGKALKVRLDSNNMVFVEGITEVSCCTADECMKQIDFGNVNRATSSTRMNAESSRSHCVIILTVICKKLNGTIRTSKVKMIDLAGSETVKKTEASGQRLEEAKAINRSLSELNGVLTALGKPGAHVNFRNSMLTMLLQDSLGGNAKTSLLLAASPCSYNREETISSLRFGERAKKVKNNAVINEDLTIDDYKKLVAKLKRDNQLKDKLIMLKDAQLAAAGEWVAGHDGDFDSLIDASQFNLGEETEEGPDMSQMDFDSGPEISDKAFVINKKTGKVLAGNAFSVDIDETPEDRAKRMAGEHSEGVKKACMALHRQLTRRVGEYDVYDERKNSPVEDLLEEIDSLKAQLACEENSRETCEEMLRSVEDTALSHENELARSRMELQELAVYKAKCLFLQRQSEVELARLAADLEYFQLVADDHMTDDDCDDSVGDLFNSCDNEELKSKFQHMAQRVRKQQMMIDNLRVDANKASAYGDQVIQDVLMAVDDEQRKDALRKMLSSYPKVKAEAKRLEKLCKQQTSRITSLARKGECSAQIKENWQQQLASMEKALVQVSHVYRQHKQETTQKLESKDVLINRLQEHVKRMNLARSQNTVVRGSNRRVQNKQQSKLNRKRRPRKRSTSPDQVAAN